jgi:hypothetical protein
LVLIAIVLLLSACNFRLVIGSGRRVIESREISDFDRVSLTGLGQVVLIPGDGPSLTIETDRNVMPHVISEVRGGMLILGTKGGTAIRPTRLRYILEVKDLEGLVISGLGDIRAESFYAGQLDIRVSGAGDVRIDDLVATRVAVEITGSGNVELAGEVTDQSITISGSGHYRGEDLFSETASVTISGSGDATVWVEEFLKADLTDRGSTYYYGDPSLDISRLDSGRIIHRGTR